MMKSNVKNMLAQAASELNTNNGRWSGYYAAGLEELSEHLRQLGDGRATLDEFCEHYCLERGAPPSWSAEWPKVDAAGDTEALYWVRDTTGRHSGTGRTQWPSIIRFRDGVAISCNCLLGGPLFSPGCTKGEEFWPAPITAPPAEGGVALSAIATTLYSVFTCDEHGENIEPIGKWLSVEEFRADGIVRSGRRVSHYIETVTVETTRVLDIDGNEAEEGAKQDVDAKAD